MAKDTPFTWTAKGLSVVTIDNLLQAPLFNIAYILETTLQNSTDDPSFSKRLTNDQKLVFLSYPLNSPILPYIVIEQVGFVVDPIGKTHVKPHQDYQIKVIGKRNAQITSMLQKVNKQMKISRDTFHTNKMNYDPVNFVSSYLPVQDDPDLPGMLYSAITFRFFNIIV